MSSEDSVSRRGFLRVAGGTAAVAGSAGTAAAQESGGGATQQPDFGGWIEGIDGGYTDARGQSSVTVEVGASGNGGNYAFNPAGLWVDEGTTVTWEWTGSGGGHNVHAVEGPASFQSETVSTEGHTFEHTFESGGITNYQCDPHESLGMKGAVAVGSGVPTIAVGGGYESILPESAKTIGVGATGAMVGVLGLAYFLMRYGGDYETQS